MYVYYLIMVMVSWVYAYVQIPQNVYIIYVQLFFYIKSTLIKPEKKTAQMK